MNAYPHSENLALPRQNPQPTRRTCLHLATAAAAAAVVVAGGAGMPREVRAAEVGQRPPALALPTAEGHTASLEALRGKVVLVDFWASWCGPCKLSFPWLSQMQARHGARGLQVLAVNVDRDRRAAEGFLRALAPQMAAPLLVAYDIAGETPRSFKVTAMPSCVLIGADGLVVLQHAGFRDDDRAPLEAAIVTALQRAGR
jgi:thiol-disulfide isomerase/thioredoxin